MGNRRRARVDRNEGNKKGWTQEPIAGELPYLPELESLCVTSNLHVTSDLSQEGPLSPLEIAEKFPQGIYNQLQYLKEVKSSTVILQEGSLRAHIFPKALINGINGKRPENIVPWLVLPKEFEDKINLNVKKYAHHISKTDQKSQRPVAFFYALTDEGRKYILKHENDFAVQYPALYLQIFEHEAEEYFEQCSPITIQIHEAVNDFTALCHNEDFARNNPYLALGVVKPQFTSPQSKSRTVKKIIEICNAELSEVRNKLQSMPTDLLNSSYINDPVKFKQLCSTLELAEEPRRTSYKGDISLADYRNFTSTNFTQVSYAPNCSPQAVDRLFDSSVLSGKTPNLS